ncbi:hypothetical protein Cgig2_019085 [Carnegiea gigantea]|uniref:Uncharacterized protein n=1 Tax=Carnegiea gigantea TaxID=171969 RepID=A0A9Q1KE58_9CARY|nr:hypothetical protein Cgig2_019085 [Carnegiea gigantea]
MCLGYLQSLFYLMSMFETSGLLSLRCALRYEYINTHCTKHTEQFVYSGCLEFFFLYNQKTVVTTKSVEYMPFLLSFFLFLNGGIWEFYAVLHRDIYLLLLWSWTFGGTQIPNGTGCMLGVAQLVLYAMYMNAKPTKSDQLSEKLMEEGSQAPEVITSSKKKDTKSWWNF